MCTILYAYLCTISYQNIANNTVLSPSFGGATLVRGGILGVSTINEILHPLTKNPILKPVLTHRLHAVKVKLLQVNTCTINLYANICMADNIYIPVM